MIRIKYLFDVAIYRRSERAYYAQFDRDRKRYMEWAMSRPGMRPGVTEIVRGMEERFARCYPVPWRFNNIIGYIHLFAYHDQIRGNLFMVDGVRFNRQMKKRFVDHHCTFTILVQKDSSNEDLSRTVRAHLIATGEKFGKKDVHVDTEAFDSISHWMDWLGLLGSLSP